MSLETVLAVAGRAPGGAVVALAVARAVAGDGAEAGRGGLTRPGSEDSQLR
ncbi:hypothetical protein [Rhodosalinus sp.]|uniref:hypothetical protein n=1 Tax=Rhodosalinus sp. TaxID=2047741 RepID=UPI003561D36E